MSSLAYAAFGLNIESELPLPALIPQVTAGAADLNIVARPVACAFANGDDEHFAISDAEAILGWKSAGSFRLLGGRTIQVDLEHATLPQLFSYPLLGAVMSLALAYRGLAVLHGSAVAVGRKSAVFLGDKGAGKSTTAAFAVARGHTLITDDVAAIRTTEPPSVEPSFPQIKVDEDMRDMLASPTVDVERHPALDKLVVRLADDVLSASVPVGGIFVLQRGANAEARQLSPMLAVAHLNRFCFLRRFGDIADAPQLLKSHHQALAWLAERVPLYQLTVPDRRDRVGEAIELVEELLARR